jgi:hypothetical protein
VHHILVHSCPAGVADQYATPRSCSSPLGQCDSLLWAWAVGGGPMELPAEAGVRFNATVNMRVVLEVHYNNAAQRPDVRDASGVRMVVTRQLRPFDAGVLVTGDPGLGFDPLPAGKAVVHRQVECCKECTASVIAPNSSVTIFASFRHMHSFGRETWSNVYDSSMRFKRQVAPPLDFWSFGAQLTTPISRDPVRLEPGDTIFTHCRFNTEKWPSAVAFGMSSVQEMCMDFLYVWPVLQHPKSGKPWTLCGSAKGLKGGLSLLNTGDLPKDTVVGVAAAAFPYMPDTGFANLCNRDVIMSPGVQVSLPLGPFGSQKVQIPVNRVDPRVYSESAKRYEHAASFGAAPAAPGECPAPAALNATCPPREGACRAARADFAHARQALGIVELCWNAPRMDADGASCAVDLLLHANGTRWLALGLGTQMLGSQALIGDQWYDLVAKAAGGAVKAPNGGRAATLLASSVASQAGASQWRLTLRLASQLCGAASLIVAAGREGETQLGYHDAATAFTVDWDGPAAAPPTPATAPPSMPPSTAPAPASGDAPSSRALPIALGAVGALALAAVLGLLIVRVSNKRAAASDGDMQPHQLLAKT